LQPREVIGVEALEALGPDDHNPVRMAFVAAARVRVQPDAATVADLERLTAAAGLVDVDLMVLAEQAAAQAAPDLAERLRAFADAQRRAMSRDTG
ncbi:MAG: hypothetical protein KC621_32830, partial [Myxococcales bacterium]|nr:hypothetical protein [Myxococcales bacterium]